MSKSMDQLVAELQKSINESEKRKTKAFDTQAEVTRVDAESNTIWVKIPGGTDETPIRRTVDAKPGDNVQVRIANGRGWVVGNATSPPTDDTVAIQANENASIAGMTANEALESAASAQQAADTAWSYANSANIAANDAQTSANSASKYASRALGNLSTVQSVAETLTWITQHGTMTITADVEPVSSHVYFVEDANGDYTVNNVKYSIVSEPKEEDMALYYELSIDESLNNYVGTHLALTDEGLWLLPGDSASNYKILISVGDPESTLFSEPGTYIVDASGAIVASFTSDGTNIYNEDGDSIAEFGSQLRIGKKSSDVVDLEIVQRSLAGTSLHFMAGDVSCGYIAPTFWAGDGVENASMQLGSGNDHVRSYINLDSDYLSGELVRYEYDENESSDIPAYRFSCFAKLLPGVNNHKGYIVVDSEYVTIDQYGRTKLTELTLPSPGSMIFSGQVTNLIDYIYPVGSYYETSDTTFDPNTAWGGTWILENEGLVHIGAGENYTVGSTGGSKDAIVVEHTHTIENAGSHAHTYSYGVRSTFKESGDVTEHGALNSIEDRSTSAAGDHTHTVNQAGSSGTDANMPPYIAVNRWHRTA